MKFYYISLCLLIMVIAGCSNKDKENKVSIEQLNIDNSSNYKYIFKDSIETDKKNEKKPIDAFKD